MDGGFVDEEGAAIPSLDFIELTLENDFSVAVRPSGTEPKIKYYLFGCDNPAPNALAESKEKVEVQISEIGAWLVEDAHQRAKTAK